MWSAKSAKSLQSCPTLCDPIDSSPSGSSIPGILQARTLEWVAISFSNAWKWKVKVKLVSHVWLFVTPWSAAYQAPPPMGFSRQEYWSGVPFPSPDLLLPFSKTLIPNVQRPFQHFYPSILLDSLIHISKIEPIALPRTPPTHTTFFITTFMFTFKE